MINVLKRWLGGDPLKKFAKIVAAINSLESEIQSLTDLELRTESFDLRDKIKQSGETEEIIGRAFALVREASRRTLGQRPFDVQLLGGLVLHHGGVVEMITGEGKTLAAVAPAYLNALLGRGVHVVTVNEYLARRDTVWMGQIYQALGLSVACIAPQGAFRYDPDWRMSEPEEVAVDAKRDATGAFLIQQQFLRPISRREAYLTDITYGTNHEFGFDYLRDNLAYRPADQVQTRGLGLGSEENQSELIHHYAIIDEVDSILIDEARTPLIISAPDAEASEHYQTFARLAGRLKKDQDYLVDEKFKSVSITDQGIEKVEKLLGLQDLYGSENFRLVHFLEESLRAHALYRRDKEYVVKNGEVIIVDEFTGRLLHGRRYSGGLHQAIEAKEGVIVKEESRTYAKISIQNYFRLYKKIAGMTGTAQTSAEEFHKVYGLEVVSIPPNRPLIRADESDVIYKNTEVKWQAVVDKVKSLYDKGQPVLLGTTSIVKNEYLSAALTSAGIRHEVLNAKNNEQEGAIIAQAGRLKAVTVATNMAGRGVDIILGGNPPNLEEAQRVKELGGLFILGTERHEARRIDNQLRGRAGRQGDSGASQFFLSLEDDLMRIFGGERVKNLMERFKIPDDLPIDLAFVSKVVSEAQAKVEGANFDLRKHLLEYDDVLNKQRLAVYKRRQEILENTNLEQTAKIIFEAAKSRLEQFLNQVEAVDDRASFWQELRKMFEISHILDQNFFWPEVGAAEPLIELLERRSREAASDPQTVMRLLGILDMLWLNHLENIEALSESVGLRAYGQRDPLVEYRRESHRLYNDFWENWNGWVFENIFRLAQNSADQYADQRRNISLNQHLDQHQPVFKSKIGRNDPCPCGAVNPATGHIYKYKKCGMINASQHRKS